MAERTPLYDVEERAGATFAEEAGWLMPAHYGDALAEYRAALDGAAVFDVSHRGKIEARGPDAATFLQNLCTNEIKNLAPGSGCEAFFCNVQARVLGHAHIYHLVEEGQSAFWLDVVPGTAENLAKHLDRYLISEQVEISDQTRDFVQFHVVGPQAPAVLKQPTQGIPEPRRHDVLGLVGYDVLCTPGKAAELWQLLLSTGVQPAGLEAYHILRIEAGTPVYGIDFDENNLAPEVGRTKQAISYTKGCYLGQEPIVRIRDLGHVNRTLVGLRLSTNSHLPRGTKLFRDGKEVGHVTSSVVSPRMGTIGLAYVRRGNESVGTKLTFSTVETPADAEVASLPFAGSG
ncbi:MAG TPA: aminomethyltransferase family protein [Gemmataceae bacterium]|nr:aminomethyltransferase family protein [Gemmataceae bacterium]